MIPESPSGYRILEPLGSGASSTVYLAEQLATKRLVAIKMLHFPGDALARKRLLREAETLATLHHPGIVNVLEAGELGQGRGEFAYIVMEYVAGEPLSRSQVASQGSIGAKLRLVISLCEALFHAHQRGVLHRDIKPDNLLVDADGEAHLLDFGIAQALDGSADRHTRLTRREDIIGTLAYMSPEQISSQDAGVQSDIYAVGVLAFELLTGVLPIAISGLGVAAAIEAKLEQQPERLRDRLAEADRTLDAILAKALATDTNRRYLSVKALADDLRAWLAGEPVRLESPSTAYFVRQIWRKHRLAAVSMGMFFLSVMLAGVVAAMFAVKEASARKLAEQESERAEVINQILVRLLVSADPDRSQGRDLTVLSVVEDAAPVISELSRRRPLIGAELSVLLADVLRNLGELEKAELTLNSVRELAGASNQPELRLHWATAMASVLRGQGKADQSLALLQEAKPLSDSLPDSNLTKASYLAEMGSALIRLGNPEAAAQLRKTIALPLGDSPEAAAIRLDSMHNLALNLRETGDLQESQRLISEVVGERTRQLGAMHPSTLYSVAVQGSVLSLSNDHAGAESLYRQVLEGRKQAYGELHFQTINAETNLLNSLVSQKKFAQADQLSLSLLDKLAGQQGAFIDQRITVGNMRAYLLEDLGRLEEAESLYLKTLELLKSQTGVSVQNYALENNLGMLLMRMDRLEDARIRFETVLAEMHKLGATEHIFYAITRNNLGECLTKMGDYDHAHQHLSESLDSLKQKFGAEHPRTQKAQARLASLQQAEAGR